MATFFYVLLRGCLQFWHNIIGPVQYEYLNISPTHPPSPQKAQQLTWRFHIKPIIY